MEAINKEKIIEILRETQNVRFAYLFGSQVKNKNRFGSDLDIALYFDNEPSLPDIGMLVTELERESDFKVDIISLNDLCKKNSKLAYSVLDEGILLFCLDDNFLKQYKKMVYQEYLDFKPVIDLFTRKLMERISNKKFAVVER